MTTSFHIFVQERFPPQSRVRQRSLTRRDECRAIAEGAM